jgi:hypothetical protein
VFIIPNKEVNQLHRHTHAYLQSIGQIPVIYQIPRARASQRRTQPYGENETLSSTIDDLIIDTISAMKEPIATIGHSENKEDREFQNFIDFLEVDSTFHDFPEIEASGFGPPESLEINHTCINPLYPRPNFNFLATMATNIPSLAANAVMVPGIQHPLPKHPQNVLPKFDPDNNVKP